MQLVNVAEPPLTVTPPSDPEPVNVIPLNVIVWPAVMKCLCPDFSVRIAGVAVNVIVVIVEYCDKSTS